MPVIDAPQPSLSPRSATAIPAGGLARFLMTCDAAQAYLRLADRSGTHVRLLKMQPQSTAGRWGLVVTLKPGTYRYRYYAQDGQMTTYVSPRDAEESARPMECLDAVLSVPAQSTDPSLLHDKHPRQFVPS